MSAAKHTPAPWVIDQEDLDHDPETVFSLGIWAGEGESKVMVTHVSAFGIHTEHRDGVDYSTTAPAEQSEIETAIANARLIAAAPELLAALKAVTQHAVYDPEGSLTREEFDALMAQADAAVDKAEGGAA